MNASKSASRTDIPRVVETFVPFGARLEGLDFRRPSDEAVAAVKRALGQHHVLVSRGHVAPDDDEITAYFRRFGTLCAETPEVKAHYARLAKLVPEYLEGGAAEIGTRYNLSNVEEDGKKLGGLGNRELEWHNDQSDMPRLKTISCLEALDFEQGAGNTFFCDMYAALDALPRETRQALDGLYAIHDSSRYRSADGANIAAAPSASHPVILAHPDTGRRCLYVNPNFTSSIVGLAKDESDEILKTVFAHAYRPEFIYEHLWRTGDLVIWDNVGLQHMRPPIDPTRRRTLRAFQGVAETLSVRLPGAAASALRGAA
ncbi:MAG: TauD/TfdA family dioxygenase [Rhodospirillaceae bacterium]|nr:TauD/TfdA family dioxygenase [Rhodospirillaceae bacterium]